MSADIIDTPCPVTLTETVTFTETAWKKEASRNLQDIGRDKQDADKYAEYLYQIYVTEGGFTKDDFFSLDPYGAVRDDDLFTAQPRTKKTLTAP